MSVYNSATTDLDAVNVMLSVIGEAPVNSLQGALPLDVSMALNLLQETTREVQLEGWHFNSEPNYPLEPAADGFIYLPPTLFRITLQDPDGRDVVPRGQRLYDRMNHTYSFTETIEAEVNRLLSFDEMPETFRWYVTIRAARKFSDRTVGSSELRGFTREDEAAARVAAVREDNLLARPSMAKGEAVSFISGWTVSQTLRR